MSWRLGAYARRVIAGKRRLPRRVIEPLREAFFRRQWRRYGNQAYDRVLRANALGQRMGWRAPVPMPAAMVHAAAQNEGRNIWFERRGQQLLPYDLNQRRLYQAFLRGTHAVDLNFIGDLTE